MTISRLVRRIHMYLALFLAPWILMYALSTVAGNHRSFLRTIYGDPLVEYTKEKEIPYRASFAPDIPPRIKAEHVLVDLDLPGRYFASGGRDSSPLTIHRLDPIIPRRISYLHEEGKLVIEREIFRTPTFLLRLHHRHRVTFPHPWRIESLWAFSVDLVIVSMIFWVLSGLWMWWGLEVTRRWGAVCMVVGGGLFALFLLTITAMAFQGYLSLLGLPAAPTWTQRFERPYRLPVSDDADLRPHADLREIGAEILEDAGLQGLFNVSRPNPDRINVTVFDFWSQTSLSYDISRGRIRAQDRRRGWTRVLVGMHVRESFQQESILSDLWALTLDIVCAGFLIWIASGLYMWWKLKRHRWWGAMALSGGCVSFLVFLLTL